MIKYASFRFEKLDVPDHWVNFPAFGKKLSSEVKFADTKSQFDLALTDGEVYQVSLDQSTSNTGIFIKNYYNTEAYMVEVRREKGEDAGEYTYHLELLLHGLFENHTISHLIYEKPIRSANYRSSQVLFQLEGMITSLRLRYPEFKNTKIDNITNSSWYSSVTNDFAGEVNLPRKKLSKYSVETIWDWTQDYQFSIGADEDIYEAIGVMMGWFFVSFDPLGRPYVRGNPATRTLGAFVLPGFKGEKVIGMLKENKIDAQLFIANPNMPIARNLSVFVERYEVACVEFTDPYSMLTICMECNMKWENWQVLTVIFTDAACICGNLKEVTGGAYHFTI